MSIGEEGIEFRFWPCTCFTMTARGAGVLLSTPKREIPGEHHERGHEGKSPSLPRLLAESRGTREVESIKSEGEEETAMLDTDHHFIVAVRHWRRNV